MRFFIAGNYQKNGFEDDYNIHTKTPITDIKRICKYSFFHLDVHITCVAPQSAYLGEAGQTALRLKGDYDILLTNRLILQPTAEINLYGKNDPQRATGSGLSDTEVGLRLRYEIRREFAPYIGVTWNRAYGKTADYRLEEGEDQSDTRFVVGVRMWF